MVSVSPARSGWQAVVEALRLVQEAKRAKHVETCLAYGFEFSPFSISMSRSCGPAPEMILGRVYQRYVSQARIARWEAHQWVYRRLSLVVMCGIAERFFFRQSSDLSW